MTANPAAAIPTGLDAAAFVAVEFVDEELLAAGGDEDKP